MSATIRPSARKTARSAYDAATGSWVTMTMVWPKFRDRGLHEREHFGAAARVEVAGRFVGEDDLRPGDQCPRHGDALLLSAGQLRGRCASRVAEPDGLDDLVEPGLVELAAGEAGRQPDVLGGVERRDEVERLEDEADPVAPQQGEPTIVERPSRCRRSSPGPSVRVSRPATQCSSVDFPEPDGPMMAVKRPASKSDRDTVERADLSSRRVRGS